MALSAGVSVWPTVDWTWRNQLVTPALGTDDGRAGDSWRTGVLGAASLVVARRTIRPAASVGVFANLDRDICGGEISGW